MKTNFPALAMVTLLTACATQQPPAPVLGSVHTTPQAAIQAPQITAGQQWTYKRIDLWKNEEVERFSQTFNLQANQKWAVAWGILSSTDADRLGTTTEKFDASTHSFADPRMSGQYVPLKFPLSPGKSWAFSYLFKGKSDTLVVVNQTAMVGQWESVTVPAGTFNALRVAHTGSYSATQGSRSWSGTITETYWYAPEVGRVVAHEYKDTTGRGSIWDQRRDELVDMRK